MHSDARALRRSFRSSIGKVLDFAQVLAKLLGQNASGVLASTIVQLKKV